MGANLHEQVRLARSRREGRRGGGIRDLQRPLARGQSSDAGRALREAVVDRAAGAGDHQGDQQQCEGGAALQTPLALEMFPLADDALLGFEALGVFAPTAGGEVLAPRVAEQPAVVGSPEQGFGVDQSLAAVHEPDLARRRLRR